MKFDFNFPDLGIPSFSELQLLDLGQTGEQAMRDRIAEGLNVEGAPAKPLAKNYATAKQRRGLRPIRDLRYSGALMGSLVTEPAGNDAVEIGFSDPGQEAKAARLESIEPMFGLSGADVRKVSEHAERFFGDNVAALNRK